MTERVSDVIKTSIQEWILQENCPKTIVMEIHSRFKGAIRCKQFTDDTSKLMLKCVFSPLKPLDTQHQAEAANAIVENVSGEVPIDDYLYYACFQDSAAWKSSAFMKVQRKLRKKEENIAEADRSANISKLSRHIGIDLTGSVGASCHGNVITYQGGLSNEVDTADSWDSLYQFVKGDVELTIPKNIEWESEMTPETHDLTKFKITLTKLSPPKPNPIEKDDLVTLSSQPPVIA